MCRRRDKANHSGGEAASRVNERKRATQKLNEQGRSADTLREISSELRKNKDVIRNVAKGQEKSRQHEKIVILLPMLTPD